MSRSLLTLTLFALLAATSSAPAQGDDRLPGHRPGRVVEDPFGTTRPIPGTRPGTERWIVHFDKRAFDLGGFRREMHGARDAARAAVTSRGPATGACLCTGSG